MQNANQEGGDSMSDRLTDEPVSQFLNALASSAPAPGGGSAAALSGALGAALVSMVCNLTLGKKKYADVQDEIGALVEQSEDLRNKLTELLEADVQVYTGVSNAYKMPRKTTEEKAARSAAIQEALKDAAKVPMQVAQACAQVLDLCTPAAERGNVNVVSDAGVAALMAEAGLRSAALNVIININAIKDAAFSDAMRDELNLLLEGRPALKDQIYELVVSKL
jgi:formiminotetrahydrofolate cyclodeaminase